jgi:hypothetical protein
MENALRQRVVRVMANYLRSLNIDLTDRSLCYMMLWNRGFRADALRECLDAARLMTLIRTVNDRRHAQ